MRRINIVLHEPEIPQNTGNIARTCAATGAALHIIKPMGFTIDDKKLKRAGLDYWDKLDITYYENYEDFITKCSDAKNVFYSTHGRRCGFVTADEGESVNTATFKLLESDVYFRLSVVDEFGRRADSQAYFLSEI